MDHESTEQAIGSLYTGMSMIPVHVLVADCFKVGGPWAGNGENHMPECPELHVIDVKSICVTLG